MCILLHATSWETYLEHLREKFGNTKRDQQVMLKSN